MQRKIVIIGAGFAGIEVARGLGSSQVDITLIDRQNFHLFQPLLYQVATAALSPADIAQPIRQMFRGQVNLEIRLGEVTGISAADQTVTLSDGDRLPYDILVIAAGASTAYFGHDDWEKFAPGLKTVEDARSIRSRILLSFEKAEMSSDLDERKRLTTFVVIGGGPSGVELASSIAELGRHALANDFRHIDPKATTVFLLEAGPRILSAFPESLSRYAVRKLGRLGVTVRENCMVKNISANSIAAGGQEIKVGLSLWAAGVKASPVAGLLGVSQDKAGRLSVNGDLSVAGFSEVYAIGDIALAAGKDGLALPGLAQVAKQQGQYLGRALAEKLANGTEAKPFVFHDRGNVAIIGRHAAVADFGWARLSGALAWLLWAIVHIYLLAGLQHRLLVAIQWLWRYVTFDRGARLIIEPRHMDGP